MSVGPKNAMLDGVVSPETTVVTFRVGSSIVGAPCAAPDGAPLLSKSANAAMASEALSFIVPPYALSASASSSDTARGRCRFSRDRGMPYLGGEVVAQSRCSRAGLEISLDFGGTEYQFLDIVRGRGTMSRTEVGSRVFAGRGRAHGANF